MLTNICILHFVRPVAPTSYISRSHGCGAITCATTRGQEDAALAAAVGSHACFVHKGQSMQPLGCGMGRQSTKPAVVICPLLAAAAYVRPWSSAPHLHPQTKLPATKRGEVATLPAGGSKIATSSVGVVRAQPWYGQRYKQTPTAQHLPLYTSVVAGSAV
jgi:hypothetical protein